MRKTLTGIGMASMVTAGAALAAPPLVTGVTLVQPDKTRLATVTFVTDGPGIATFQMKTNGADVIHSEAVRTVAGDINRWLPAAGTHSFTWDAGRDKPEWMFSNLTCEVTLWATNAPPTYCAVNLVADGGGRFPVRWYGKVAELPGGAENSRWKKDWLLLRQIPATLDGSVTLGSPGGEWGRVTDEAERTVRITQPFYMGVYEVTQAQWERIGTRSKPSGWNNTTDWEMRPVEKVSWFDIRSSANGNKAVAGTDWPADGHAVGAGSFMQKLREKTGDAIGFDLPTEAQWEYACRAGTTGPWNNGIGASGSDADENLKLLGRFRSNGGQNGTTSWPADSGADKATATVGSYLPNAWGLYDMHGNTGEWCLDWYIASGTSLLGDDPAGPASGTAHVWRGGNLGDAAQSCRSARRNSSDPTTRKEYLGFRVAAPAVVLITE